MGVPFSRDLSASQAAIVGVPFDCGTHPVRVGARLGPAASPIVEAGAMPIALGGEGAISLTHMRHRRHEWLVVLHIDAHTDYPSYGSSVRHRYNTATTFTRAAEEGLTDAAGSYHVGACRPVLADGVFEFTRHQGHRLIPGEERFRRGLGVVVAELCTGGVHADLGWRIGAGGSGVDPVAGGFAVRGLRGEHGQWCASSCCWRANRRSSSQRSDRSQRHGCGSQPVAMV